MSAFAIVSSLVKEKSHINKYIGIIQMSYGIGMIVGPSLGTLLYSIGGFVLNYQILIILYAILFILILAVLPNKSLLEMEEENSDSSDCDTN